MSEQVPEVNPEGWDMHTDATGIKGVEPISFPPAEQRLAGEQFRLLTPVIVSEAGGLAVWSEGGGVSMFGARWADDMLRRLGVDGPLPPHEIVEPTNQEPEPGEQQ